MTSRGTSVSFLTEIPALGRYFVRRSLSGLTNSFWTFPELRGPGAGQDGVRTCRRGGLRMIASIHQARSTLRNEHAPMPRRMSLSGFVNSLLIFPIRELKKDMVMLPLLADIVRSSIYESQCAKNSKMPAAHGGQAGSAWPAGCRQAWRAPSGPSATYIARVCGHSSICSTGTVCL